jgi:peptidoglycan hydrolase-like protein with peptidoglycan-binding domain
MKPFKPLIAAAALVIGVAGVAAPAAHANEYTRHMQRLGVGPAETASTYSTMAPAAGTPTAPTELRLDSQSVASVQNALRTRGYGIGPADGVLGPQTSAALRRFQADNGLTPTGTVTAETASQLGLNFQGDIYSR